MKTYRQAKENHLQALYNLEWETVTFKHGRILKTPYACDPDTNHRIYFKAQSVYYGLRTPEHSLHVDMRRISTEELISIFHNRLERKETKQWPT